MRIVIGTECFYPSICGVALTTLNLASFLTGEGHQVAVMAPSEEKRTFAERFPTGFSVWRITSVQNPWRKDFRVTVRPLREARAVMKAWRPDLVHLHGISPITAALLRVARTQQVPVVFSHYFDAEGVPVDSWYLKPLRPLVLASARKRMVRLYNQAQEIICASAQVQGELQAAGVRTPVTVVGPEPDLRRFYSYRPPALIRSRLRLPAEPVVVCTGCESEAHQRELVRAMLDVLQQVPAHFVLVGAEDPAQVSHVLRLAEQEGVGTHLTVPHPAGDRHERPLLFQVADCLVMLSANGRHRHTLVEALAAGLPVVAPEGESEGLVTDGENGFLYQRASSEELALRVGRILADDELRGHMGQRSLQQAVALDLEGSLPGIQEVYQRALRVKGG
ncbi:MAG: glycosyltransferase [Syntrophomonadaceae bacterium]|nr:glycosyltransferase [Syntrophomonadaceae bacterium]MDH7498460.1 glycosyltransferase [Syntrophomonadaceae bacterium]